MATHPVFLPGGLGGQRGLGATVHGSQSVGRDRALCARVTHTHKQVGFFPYESSCYLVLLKNS